jgi:hypothetical protein
MHWSYISNEDLYCYLLCAASVGNGAALQPQGAQVSSSTHTHKHLAAETVMARTEFFIAALLPPLYRAKSTLGTTIHLVPY